MKQSDQDTLVSLLKRLKPGFLPFDIFMQVARLTTLSIIEFVPLRLLKGKVEVFLLRRPADDKLWPGGLHTPGTVIRPTDVDQQQHVAFKRIIDEELKGVEISNPVYVGSNLHSSRRGAEQAQVFWVEVLNQPVQGEFYPVDELPPEMMESQIGFVRLAADKFKRSKDLNTKEGQNG